MKKLIPFAIAAGLALGGCASTGGSSTSASTSASSSMSSSSAMHTAKDAAAAIMAAEQELMKAKAARNEWRDTGKMIKEAKKLEKDGKFDAAVKIADAAKRQSENAVAQAEDQKNAEPLY